MILYPADTLADTFSLPAGLWMLSIFSGPSGCHWSGTPLPHPAVPPLSSIRPLFTSWPPLTSPSTSPALYLSFALWHPQAPYTATGSLAPLPGPLAPWLLSLYGAPSRPFLDPHNPLSCSLSASFLWPAPWFPPLDSAPRCPPSDPYNSLSPSLSASFLTFTSEAPTSLKSTYPTFVGSWFAFLLPLLRILSRTLSSLSSVFFLPSYARGMLAHVSYYTATLTNY